MKYKINNVEISAEDIRQVVKDHPEILESKVWKPEEGEQYSFVRADGYIDIAYWYDAIIDNYRHTTNNCFEEGTQAEAKKEYDLAVGKVTRAIEEANGGWKPNWEDNKEKKYKIHYKLFNEKFAVSFDAYFKSFCILPYCKSEEIAEQIIKDYKKELEIIRDYK